MKKPTKNKLLDLLKKKAWVKQDLADDLGIDEKSVRRWCKSYGIDTELERKSSLKNADVIVYEVAKPSGNTKISNGTFVVVPDLHDQWVSWPYLDAVCSFIKDFNPEYLIQIGDLLDFEPLMKIGKAKYPSFDSQDLVQLDSGFNAASKILSRLNSVISPSSKRILLKGNHEFRADLILRSHPELGTILDIKKRLDLSAWDVKEYLDPNVKLGKLHLLHGEFYGTNHVQKHLRHYQKNLLYGHTHGIQQDTMASPMRQIPIWGASIGCGCDLNPDYQRNKSNAWQHGFAYGFFDKVTGYFDVQVKRVINASFWAEGRRYKA